MNIETQIKILEDKVYHFQPKQATFFASIDDEGHLFDINNKRFENEAELLKAKNLPTNTRIYCWGMYRDTQSEPIKT